MSSNETDNRKKKNTQNNPRNPLGESLRVETKQLEEKKKTKSK